MGVEYEHLLLATLRNRRLVFESEDELRERGLSKTPDVRLLLPIGVRDARGELRVVHWIDSKAMFGDRHTHETENAGQVCLVSCVLCLVSCVLSLAVDDTSRSSLTHLLTHSLLCVRLPTDDSLSCKGM